MTTTSKTILIVDDDEDILKLLNKILTASGFTVLTALNPDAGRIILAKEAPHLIISDLHMEPENGFQFIESVRSQKQYAAIPILVLSALNDFSSVKKAIALGVSDYVIKPLQSTMLLRKIKKALFNKDFVHWEIPENEVIEMRVELEASITAVGETGYHLSGPIKVTENKEVKVTSPEWEALGLHQLNQRASSLHKTYQAGGNFLNDITFVGINENTASKIRQFLSKRNSK